MIPTVGAFCHDSEPPLTVGSVGGPRSMRMVSPALGAAGAHADVLPAPSSARNCTSTSPSLVEVNEAAGAGDDQVAPPLVDVRTS